ncbi:MAG: hypothetical protein JWM56_36 [Candidatus Peribacteria bacterium]|nr:hypothetical protein [Candidatus Peribacteria bacterium]
MSASPFHGIFSSLRDHEEGKPIFSFDETPAANTPPASMEPQSQVPSTNANATPGRVAVDIYEQDDYYIIKAPIAGVRLSDLDIEVNDNVLTIRGTRKQADTIPENSYYLRECYWGSFSRSVTLPCSIDPRKVKATFNKDCVLKILVPKEEKIKIVRIQEG